MKAACMHVTAPCMPSAVLQLPDHPAYATLCILRDLPIAHKSLGAEPSMSMQGGESCHRMALTSAMPPCTDQAEHEELRTRGG